MKECLLRGSENRAGRAQYAGKEIGLIFLVVSPGLAYLCG